MLYAIVRGDHKFQAAHKVLLRDYAQYVSELFAYVTLPQITRQSVERFLELAPAADGDRKTAKKKIRELKRKLR